MHTFNSKPINQYIHDMYDVCNQYLKIKFYHEHTPTNQQPIFYILRYAIFKIRNHSFFNVKKSFIYIYWCTVATFV